MTEPTTQARQDIVTAAAPVRLPRVTIQFCTQCKWMLRAAYFAQELLSTFSTSLGEVALEPATGGVFVVTLTHAASSTSPSSPADSAGTGTGTGTVDGSPGVLSTNTTILWDRKAEGGFPETKELKRRVRDVIQPGRDLGHVDRHHGSSAHAKPAAAAVQAEPAEPTEPAATATADGKRSDDAVTPAAAAVTKTTVPAASCTPGQYAKCDDCE